MINDIVELYLEAHVTIEPVFDERRAQAAEIAKKHKFKLAHLLMKKEREQTETRSDKDTFMTGHSKSHKDMRARTVALCMELMREGFQVWRYKIEDTVLDSRSDDVFGLLSLPNNLYMHDNIQPLANPELYVKGYFHDQAMKIIENGG